MREYSSIEKFYILLGQFDLTQKMTESLFAGYERTEDIIRAISKGDANVKKILGSKFAEISQNFNKSYIDKIIGGLNKKEIIVLTIESENYPEQLKHIDNPPRILYCKGNINLLNTKCISVVGMRKVSEKYSQITYEFAQALSRCGFTIVSGMADGVDKIAHIAALDLKNPTIAVLAGGFDNIYPASHFDLFGKICKTGLVICEYRPCETPQKYRFIHRNRIVAGLSCGTLVTCAGENSGTFSTARFAVENGRELFLIPGDINAPDCKGTNNMIADLQGAAVLSPLDIVKKLGCSIKEVYDDRFDAQAVVEPDIQEENCSAKNRILNNSTEEQQILNTFKNEPLHFSELLYKISLSEREILANLTMLQIEGKIRKLPNNYYEKITDY